MKKTDSASKSRSIKETLPKAQGALVRFPYPLVAGHPQAWQLREPDYRGPCIEFSIDWVGMVTLELLAELKTNHNSQDSKVKR